MISSSALDASIEVDEVIVCLFQFICGFLGCDLWLNLMLTMASNGNGSLDEVLLQLNLMKWPFYWYMLRVNITEITSLSALLNSVCDVWVLPKGRYILRSFGLFICHIQFIFKDNGSKMLHFRRKKIDDVCRLGCTCWFYICKWLRLAGIVNPFVDVKNLKCLIHINFVFVTVSHQEFSVRSLMNNDIHTITWD